MDKSCFFPHSTSLALLLSSGYVCREITSQHFSPLLGKKVVILEHLENQHRSDTTVPLLRPDSALLNARWNLSLQPFLQYLKSIMYKILNAATMSAVWDIIDRRRQACHMLEEQLDFMEQARLGRDLDGESKAEGETKKHRLEQECCFVLSNPLVLSKQRWLHTSSDRCLLC